MKHEDRSMMGKAVQHLSDQIRDAAWVGFVKWALNHDDIRSRFYEATGIDLDAERKVNESADDIMGGYQDDVLMQFIEFVTIEIWGLEYAPDRFRE